MRLPDQAARDRLAVLLARHGPVGAAELARQVGVSVATVHRLLAELGERAVSGGRARRARHALRRPVRGVEAAWPLYEVDEAGQARALAPLVPIHPEGSFLDLAGTGWPAPEESRDGWWDGLPYPLQDMRPQGYLGRQFARAQHRRFGVPPDPREWTDDDVLHVLGASGADASGNLVLGDAAFQLWQQGKLAAPEPLRPRALGRSYAALAEEAIASGVAGSSAAGEFPKFPALREQAGSATPHVLVKFSGSDESRAVRRWSDLLVCEHLALECAPQMPGIQSARSRIVQHAGRTFFETERFDRHGPHGRSRLTSLDTLNAAFVGEGASEWPRLADRLAALGLLGGEDAQRIRHLWWFGRLVANSDMHLGNLSFRVQDSLQLAPAYDMVPMLYAPLPGGELPTREFTVPLPLPAQRAVWDAACAAALQFWTRAATDARISEAFRALCAANQRLLQETAARL